MKSLLEKAKETPVRKSKEKVYTSEEIELVTAWLDSEIGLNQLQQALKFKHSTSSYSFIALACRQVYGKNGK